MLFGCGFGGMEPEEDEDGTGMLFVPVFVLKGVLKCNEDEDGLEREELWGEREGGLKRRMSQSDLTYYITFLFPAETSLRSLLFSLCPLSCPLRSFSNLNPSLFLLLRSSLVLILNFLLFCSFLSSFLRHLTEEMRRKRSTSTHNTQQKRQRRRWDWDWELGPQWDNGKGREKELKWGQSPSPRD